MWSRLEDLSCLPQHRLFSSLGPRVPARISEQQCCVKLNTGVFELGVASIRFGMERARPCQLGTGNSWGVVEHAWTFLNESRQLDSKARRILHVVKTGNVFGVLLSWLLWALGLGVCGAGWFSRGFLVCGLPFLCPYVFLFCVFQGDVHSRSIDLAVTELRRAPTQEPAPLKAPLAAVKPNGKLDMAGVLQCWSCTS